MRLPTILELFKAGVHFGHIHSKWHPKMAPYIYTTKDTVHIIDLEKTIEKLKEALDYLKDLRKREGVILFIGLKPQIEEIIKEKAKEIKMPYVIERWIGGTLTNFSVIRGLIEKLEKLEKEKASGEFSKYTKKEQMQLDQKINKLLKIVEGIRNLKKLPEALFIIDCKKAKTAIQEAKRMAIPIVAMVDTNVNPENIAWPIPANDDSIKSVKMIVDLVTEAIKEGEKEKTSETQQAETTKS